MAAAAEALGHHLGVSRAGYVEIDPTGEFFTGERYWTDTAVRSLVGRYRLDDFGPDLIREYRENRILRVEDVLADPRSTDQGHANFASIDTRAAVGVPLLRAGRFAAAFYVHQATPRRWRDDEVALVRDVAERTWSTLQRVRAEAALREGEARFRALVEVSSQVVWTADAAGAILEDSPSWRAYTGQALADWQCQGRFDVVHPEDREHTLAARSAALAAKLPFTLEYRLRHHAGGYRWTLDSATPLLDAVGNVRLWVGMNIDIEDRKRAEAKTALLTREVDHRAKNALTVVQAVLRLTRAPDQKSYVRAVEGRVLALARAQTLLARDHWEGADLETLLRRAGPLPRRGGGPLGGAGRAAGAAAARGDAAVLDGDARAGDQRGEIRRALGTGREGEPHLVARPHGRRDRHPAAALGRGRRPTGARPAAAARLRLPRAGGDGARPARRRHRPGVAARGLGLRPGAAVAGAAARQRACLGGGSLTGGAEGRPTAAGKAAA